MTQASSGVLANDTDPNGYSLQAQLVTNVSDGILTLNSDGTLVYMPKAGWTGTDTFTYKDQDSGGNVSNVATVTLTVGDDTPVASGGSYTTGEDRALTGTVSASDADGDPWTASTVTQPGHGTLALNALGAFTYTPTAGFSGSDQFQYRVSDGIHPSTAATVAINVAASWRITITTRSPRARHSTRRRRPATACWPTTPRSAADRSRRSSDGAIAWDARPRPGWLLHVHAER